MKNLSISQKGPLYHLCKLSYDGSMVFYSTIDFLVFTTVVFAFAARYGIVVTELCIMLNHFHIAAYCSTKEDLQLFYQLICSHFSGMYNRRPGKMKIKWSPGLNISEKYSEKKKKTLYIYIGNNGPEKKACNKALEYRWNFLEREMTASSCKNPSGTADNRMRANRLEKSDSLLLAEAIVRDAHNANKPLSYNFFEHNYAVLSKNEWNTLAEYVLNTYLDIDYRDIVSLFGNLDAFIASASTVNGSDYDTHDDFTQENYKHYREMTAIMSKLGLSGNDALIHESGFDLYGLVRRLAFETNASNQEISRFLHIPIQIVQLQTGRQY